MRRRRIVPADPKRSTGETWAAIVSLIASSLPAVPEVDVQRELSRIAPNTHYLIGGEHLIESPLTLVAGPLACDVFTVHGAAALTTDDPEPASGASTEAEWVVYVPVPDGAPFTASD